jgi:hypothetical protein
MSIVPARREDVTPKSVNELMTQITTFNNVPSTALSINPYRKGDPLGIGITDRPKAPADPDAYLFDEESQLKNYCVSLLTREEKENRDELVKDGYFNIQQVRDYYESLGNDTDTIMLDAELIMLIDSLINYKLFIVDDNFYTREEIYENFAFIEFNTQPERYFDQKIIGEFFVPVVETYEDKRDNTLKQRATGEVERILVARTLHDVTQGFYLPRDIIRMHRKKTETSTPLKELECLRPSRIVNSKIYVAGKRFEQFLKLQDSVSVAVDIGKNQAAGTTNIFGLMQSLTMSTQPAPLAIGDMETAARDASSNKANTFTADL